MEDLSFLGTTLHLLRAGLAVIVLIPRLYFPLGIVLTLRCSSRSSMVSCKTSHGVFQPRTAKIRCCGSTWRLPYWDCAAPSPAGQNTMPSAISNLKSIEVTMPTGSQTISNPLYRYHIHPLDSSQLPDLPVSDLSSSFVLLLSLTLSSSVRGNIH